MASGRFLVLAQLGLSATSVVQATTVTITDALVKAEEDKCDYITTNKNTDGESLLGMVDLENGAVTANTRQACIKMALNGNCQIANVQVKMMAEAGAPSGKTTCWCQYGDDKKDDPANENYESCWLKTTAGCSVGNDASCRVVASGLEIATTTTTSAPTVATTKVAVEDMEFAMTYGSTLELDCALAKQLLLSASFVAKGKENAPKPEALASDITTSMITYTATTDCKNTSRQLAGDGSTTVAVTHKYDFVIPAATVEEISANTAKSASLDKIVSADKDELKTMGTQMQQTVAKAITHAAATETTFKNDATIKAKLSTASEKSATAEVTTTATATKGVTKFQARKKQADAAPASNAYMMNSVFGPLVALLAYTFLFCSP